MNLTRGTPRTGPHFSTNRHEQCLVIDHSDPAQDMCSQLSSKCIKSLGPDSIRISKQSIIIAPGVSSSYWRSMSQKAGQPAQSHTCKGEKKYINQREPASVTKVTPTFTPTLTASHQSHWTRGQEGGGELGRT